MNQQNGYLIVVNGNVVKIRSLDYDYAKKNMYGISVQPVKTENLVKSTLDDVHIFQEFIFILPY
jgi:hypothetical protein